MSMPMSPVYTVIVLDTITSIALFQGNIWWQAEFIRLKCERTKASAQKKGIVNECMPGLMKLWMCTPSQRFWFKRSIVTAHNWTTISSSLIWSSMKVDTTQTRCLITTDQLYLWICVFEHFFFLCFFCSWKWH